MRKYLLFLLLACVSFLQAGAQDSLAVYNQRALKYLNEARYDESQVYIDKAIKIRDNAVSRYYLAHLYAMEKNWPDAIKNDEMAIQLDPSFDATYGDLFYAYLQVGKWQEAQRIMEKIKQTSPQTDLSAGQVQVEEGINSQNLSRLLIFGLFTLLVCVFYRPVYLASKDKTGFRADGGVRLSELLLVSGAISGVLWAVFFAASHWIWSQNPHYSAADFTPIVRIFIFEHDGAESFVLYSMTFANMALTMILTPLALKTRLNKNQYTTVFTILMLVAAFFFFTIGFYPPLPGMDSKNIFTPLLLGGLSVGLYVVYQKSRLIACIAAVCIMAFTGFISIGPPSLPDLQFIIDPALRLMHGFKVSEIYFQYDLLMSFLAVAWMKMNISLELFPYVGQLSFFLLFIAAFFFSDRFFQTKGLSVIFIIAFIVMRFYSIYGDVPTILQVTPLRLDMWIILVIIARWKGVHHWLLGAAIGFLVLFHRNLGLLYLSSYAVLLVALYIVDAATLIQEKKGGMKELIALVTAHLKQNALNLIIIGSSIGLCFVLFHELFSKSAMLYRTLGIGMLPIAKISFYWYVPVLLSSLIALVFYYRHKLGPRYTATALFIAMLVVGNSMYFFGRSHENNILNISGILVLALFVLFDIIIFLAPVGEKNAADQAPAKPVPAPAPAPAKGKKAPVAAAPAQPGKAPQPATASFLTERTVSLALPVLFVLFVGYFYNQRIGDKMKTQYDNLTSNTFAYPFSPYPKDMNAVKQLTHNSQNVYFLDLYYDAFYYYNGGYAPQGFFSPASSWVFKKDYVGFMQGLLDKDYYVVYVDQFAGGYREYLPYLRYNQVTTLNGWVALKKETVAELLPDVIPSQYHMSVKDSIGGPGIDFGGLELPDAFTIEVIVKPEGPQVNNAMILNNLTRYNGFKGFTLQANGSFPDKYVFGFSNGTASMPNAVFDLENNKWHYLTAVVNKDSFKVYDNGKVVANMPAAGTPMPNGDNPLTIGNQGSHDAHFRGYIREVNISSGNLDESQILKNAEKVNEAMK